MWQKILVIHCIFFWIKIAFECFFAALFFYNKICSTLCKSVIMFYVVHVCTYIYIYVYVYIYNTAVHIKICRF